MDGPWLHDLSEKHHNLAKFVDVEPQKSWCLHMMIASRREHVSCLARTRLASPIEVLRSKRFLKRRARIVCAEIQV